MSTYTRNVLCNILRNLRGYKQSALWKHLNDENIHSHQDRLHDFDHRFRANLFKKVNDFPGVDTASAAIDRFLESEMRTGVVNDLLFSNPKWSSHERYIRYFMNGFFYGFDPLEIEPSLTYGAAHGFKKGGDSIELFSPQASYYSPLLLDYNRKMGINDPFFDRIGLDGERYDIAIYPIDHCFIQTVPKQWNTDRVIMKTSHHKRAFQNGLGRWMTKRLQEYLDIDLSTAQFVHQDIAHYASITGEYATVDLTSASDTIGKRWLDILPEGVRDFMLATRDHEGVLPNGEMHLLQTAAGNGCGWTFPFETLLFWCICASVYVVDFGYEPQVNTLRNTIRVYGDDIIVINDYAERVLEVLKAFGFIPNSSKSFYSGHFRESCGGDFFNGTNMRPFYASGIPKDLPSWYSFINGIYRTCFINNGNAWRAPFYRELWLRLIQSVPGRVLFGPPVLGDAVVNCIDPESEFGEDTYSYTRRRRMIKGLVPCNTGEKISVYSKARMYKLCHDRKFLAFCHESLRKTSGTTAARLGLLGPEKAVCRTIVRDRNAVSYYVKNLDLYPQPFLEGDTDSLFACLSNNRISQLSHQDLKLLRATDVYERHQAIVGSTGFISALRAYTQRRIDVESQQREKIRKLTDSVLHDMM